MASHNHMVSVQRNLLDRSIDHSDVMSETIHMLQDYFPAVKFPEADGPTHDTRRPLIDQVLRGSGKNVLDAIELMWSGLSDNRREEFASHVNPLLERAELPWRLVRGECIKLEHWFLGSGITQEALERLEAGPFAGAAAESRKSVREQASGEIKDAI